MINCVTDFNDILGVLNHYSGCLISFNTGAVKPSAMALKFCSYGSVLEMIDDHKRIGFAAFYHNDTENKRAFLSMIAVLPQYIGRGYASKLLYEVERICVADKMITLGLEVYMNNERAIRFYKKHNFKAIKFTRESKILMEKVL